MMMPYPPRRFRGELKDKEYYIIELPSGNPMAMIIPPAPRYKLLGTVKAKRHDVAIKKWKKMV